MMRTDSMPWYREPWPWLLMAGPATVIVAGVITTWIAVKSSDGLVSDDYYKQGLAINQTLQREAVAAQNGYRAEAVFGEGGRRIELSLEARAGAALPEALQMRVIHPTRAGRDGLVMLRKAGDGRYAGAGPLLSEGRWLLVLEDRQATWRLDGSLTVPDRQTAKLSPASSK